MCKNLRFSGQLFENGSSTGATREIINGEADLMIGFFFMSFLRMKFMDSIESHIGFPFVLVVPFGEELSSFEKIFKPFQLQVWILIFVVFFGGFLFIFILTKFGLKKVKEKVFGEVINPPFLNMIDICFGGSMDSLPKKSFPRILLATFLIFCFVTRNIYQGLLYQNMQSNDQKKPVMTVDEMLEKEFFFYMYPEFQEQSKALKFYSR